jgi:hypothetical protein
MTGTSYIYTGCFELPDIGAATGGVPFLGRRSPKVGAVAVGASTGAVYYIEIKCD